MAAFVLHIKDIDQSEVLRKHFSVQAEWLDEALEDADLRARPGADGSLDVTAQRSGDDILIRGQLAAKVLGTCVRCLEDVPIDVDAELTSLLTPESKRPAFVDELELDAEDLDREYFAGEEIALDDTIREHVLLEVPMRVVCPEGSECAAVAIPEHVRPPADFDASDGVDPRLAPLMDLKRKMAKNEE